MSGFILSENGGMKMKGHAYKKPFIEIEVTEFNHNETEAIRKHIKAEGVFPASIVALYSFLVLGTFDKIGRRFLSGIKSLIGILRQHNYLFHGFQSLQTIWFEYCF